MSTIINGNSLDSYQSSINGRMFETFPTPWEGDGSWETVMEQYLENLPGPKITNAVRRIIRTNLKKAQESLQLSRSA